MFGERYFELRYEDLLVRPGALFTEMVDFLGADPDAKLVAEMVGNTSFERVSGDRTVGEEDPESFYRKGISGDWKNYFTGRDRKIYKQEAGEVLTQLGYEKDEDW